MWTYCCQTPGPYFVFLMSSFVLCPFSLQITLPQCCKSPSLGRFCHWGLPSVSLPVPLTLWPRAPSPAQAGHPAPVACPLQVPASLVVSQRRSDLLRQPAVLLQPQQQLAACTEWLFVHVHADRGPQGFAGSAPVGLPARSIVTPNDKCLPVEEMKM